jgi:hypothetical protein
MLTLLPEAVWNAVVSFATEDRYIFLMGFSILLFFFVLLHLRCSAVWGFRLRVSVQNFEISAEVRRAL